MVKCQTAFTYDQVCSSIQRECILKRRTRFSRYMEKDLSRQKLKLY